MQLRKKVVRGLLVAITMVSVAALVGCGSSEDDTEDAAEVNVANRIFPFPDCHEFGLPAGIPCNLGFDATGTRFSLTGGAGSAAGRSVFGSLDLTIDSSTYPQSQGPQVGTTLSFPTAEILIGGFLDTDQAGALRLVTSEGVAVTSARPTATGTGGS
jgi:hypothetical protein